MGTRLYVGNLPFQVDESQLRALFQEGGRQVTDVKIVTDRETGRPRGSARRLLRAELRQGPELLDGEAHQRRPAIEGVDELAIGNGEDSPRTAPR